MKKIFVSSFRDLYFNKIRSIVVVLSLVMVIAFPIALSNVSPSLNQIIVEEREEYQLAHLNLFFLDIVNEEVAEKLSNWSSSFLDVDQNEIIVEGRVHDESKSQAVGNNNLKKNHWIDLDVISYEENNPMKINQIVLDMGRFPETNDELVILTSLANSDGVGIGDNITLYGDEGPLEYKITGLIQSIEYSSFELTQVGVTYMNLEGLSRYQGRMLNGSQYNSYLIFFNFEISVELLRKLYEHLKNQLSTAYLANEIEERLVFTWFTREMSFRKSLQDALELTSKYLILASIFIYIVAGVIIFVTMNRYVNEQKRVIGSLYAFGVKKQEIVLSFFFRILILSLISSIFGFLLGKYFLQLLVSGLATKWGLITDTTSISAKSLAYSLGGSIVIAYGFTYLALWNLIKLTPYEAMRGKSSELKSSGLLFNFANLIPFRLFRAAGKNLTRNRTRTILTVIAFSLSLTFSGSLMYTHDSLNHTADQYFENRLNFDLEVTLGNDNVNNQSIMNEILNLDINNDGIKDIDFFEPSLVTFIPFTETPDKLIVISALRQYTQMFDTSTSTLSEGRWFKFNTSEVVISRYVAGTVGLKIGETYSLNFLTRPFNVTVVGITNELMNSATVIMDIDHLSYLYRDLGYSIIANKILIKLQEGIDPVLVQDTLNQQFRSIGLTLTKESYHLRFTSLAGSQTEIINLLIILGLIVGFISVFTTLLISIVEREREIALLHVYGNYNYEVFIQILTEGLFLGLIGLIPGIALAQFTAEFIWIKIISDSLFEITPTFALFISTNLLWFVILSIVLSVVISFIFVTQRKLAEIIREE